MADFHIPENKIHTWIIDLNEHHAFIPEFYESLTVDEKQRADKFAFDHLRERYIVAHGILHKLLSKYLRTKNFEFYYGMYGKPYVKDFAFYFNLSHSESLAVIAFANFEIGIDIECMNREYVLDGVFSDIELKWFFGLPDNMKNYFFFRSWTRKESFLKAQGIGLLSIQNAEVSFSTPDSWSFIPLKIPHPFIGQLAFKYPKR